MWATNRRVRSEDYETWLRDLQNVHQVTEEPMSTFADLVKLTEEHEIAKRRFQSAKQIEERVAVERFNMARDLAAEHKIDIGKVHIVTVGGRIYLFDYQGGYGWTLALVEPITVS